MLHVHRADRADTLAHTLGDLLAVAPDDPFAGDLVAVPTRGVERWLTQTLAVRLGAGGPERGDGVLANVAFPTPRQVVDGATAAACGLDPDADPWTRERTLWPLLALVDAHLAEPWLAVLADHLRDSAGGAGTDGPPRRLAAVRRLAQLLDRYVQHRPAMLARWSAGEDVDASGGPLASHATWQAQLWRRLREQIDGPDPVARLADASVRLAVDPGAVDLPDRLAVFGLTRLPGSQLQILRALAAHRDVHLFVLHPSGVLWDLVGGELARAGGPVVRRADDPTAALGANRLLRSWGRDARELQLTLGGAGGDASFCASSSGPGGLLAHLQADVRADRDAPGPPRAGTADARPVLAADDDSLQVHACHGRARQVEVLRDAILHALHDDRTLEARDIIVMCPDIEAFAPLIHATFGVADAPPADEPSTDLFGVPEDTRTGGGDPPPADLRVRLADRALRQTNPTLGVVGHLLALADQRLTASQLLDFADRPPVRRRFGLDDDALVRLGDWVADAGIRWGLDAAHRAPYKLAGVAANTWRAGVDRVLLGVTMTESGQRLVGDVLPLDDVDSGAIDLAGRFAELVDRVHTTVDRFAQARTIVGWAQELARATDLLTATASRDAWQRDALDRLLAGLVDDATVTAARPAAGPAPPEVTLSLAEVRDLLDEHLQGRPTRANFRTGHLTFCTLSPMRSVPHRVVCLLGLDDTVFPRQAPRDGDDLIVADAHVGDHDGRSEDRQLLLDALMAAQDRLIVVYSGNDERTGAVRPPAVPVGELLDVVDRTVHHGQDPGAAARDAVVVRHALQPFDPRNFTPGALAAAGPFGFDHVALRGARALSAERTPRPPFLAQPLPPVTDRIVDLEDVVRFVSHPARAFLRQRLGVGAGDLTDELPDGLPLALDPLEQWAVGDRMLAARLAGHRLQDTVAAERARGALPPGSLAEGAVHDVGERVQRIAAAAAAELHRTAGLDSVDVHFTLDDGRTLSGTVAGVDADRDRLQVVGYSRVGPKHRLAAWVRLLALTAAAPERPWEAVTIGRARAGSPKHRTVTLARIGPLAADTADRRAAARGHLHDLLVLVDRGRCEPPPMACATSAAYAGAVAAGGDPIVAAGRVWTSQYGYPREDAELEHQRLFSGVLTLQQLLAAPPRADEQGPGWDDAQPSRVGRWAVRLWAPLLAAETLEER